jgi:uncharacterized membrane protein YfcA
MSAELIAYVLAVYLVAGMVKGVVGLGLPTISLALIAAVLGLKEAMVLLLVPSLVTNFWQGAAGGRLIALLRRLWPMLAMLCVGTWFATGVLVRGDGAVLTAILGGVLIVYAAVSLATPQIAEPGRREVWLSPLVGGVTGIFTGLTGTFVVPGVLFLQALRLGRDGLVQAMGICFTTATLVLGLSLGIRGYLPADLGLISAVSVLPALIGMVLGRWVRSRVPEARFRRIFFIALLVLGVWITTRSVLF